MLHHVVVRERHPYGRRYPPNGTVREGERGQLTRPAASLPSKRKKHRRRRRADVSPPPTDPNIYVLAMSDGWPSTFPYEADGSVREGTRVFSRSGEIEGRTTGSRRRCISNGCPGWFIGVQRETGQLMHVCSEGWAYSPSDDTVAIRGVRGSIWRLQRKSLQCEEAGSMLASGGARW